MAWVIPALQIATQIGETVMNKNQTDKTNRYNVMLARENREWSEKMSDTAVQRRADDIEAAGGNRALAFTGGQEASSPVVQPARAEAPRIQAPNITSAALTMAQLNQIAAQTRLTNAQAQGQTIRNNVDNAFSMQVAAINMDLKTMQKQKGEKEYELLEQQIKNAVQTELNLKAQQAATGISAGYTALQTQQLRRTMDALVQTAMQQARAGQIDLAALENVATVGGVEAGKANSVIKTILDALRVFTKGR